MRFVEKKHILLEHHPNDSRVRIVDDGICQTLSQRMGTGGGNVPLVIEIDADIQKTEKSDVERRLRNMGPG